MLLVYASVSDHGMPESMTWTCALCPDGDNSVTGALEDVTAHLSEAHGMQPERWPDGGLVIDTSDVPELLLGES